MFYFPEEVLPKRIFKGVSFWQGDQFVLTSKHSGHHQLNSSAAFVMDYCDGSHSVRDIIDATVSAYPDEAVDTIESSIHNALSYLCANSIIDLAAKNTEAVPIVRVQYLGFWQGFDPKDCYFTNLLSERICMLLADDNVPDIAIFSVGISKSEFKKDKYQNCVLVFVSDGQAEPDFTQCDYAFSPFQVAKKFTSQHSRIAIEEYRNFSIPDAYAESRISRNGKEFYHYLFGANDVAQETKSSTGNLTNPKLTIGMATYDDFDGVYFTMQAIRLFHSEVTEEIEILLIDNNPSGPTGDTLRKFADNIENCRYCPVSHLRGTAVRNYVFYSARGEYVLCMDCHVLLEPGSIRKLLDYFECNPDCGDLLQGPLIMDDMKRVYTHFDPVWRKGMFGIWGEDQRGTNADNPGFEIPMQGLGVFACRKENWPGFSHAFRGFGGEEGYIHEKFRQQGGKTLCLPFLRWMHRFGRPAGQGYRNLWKDRLRNYLIGFQELGLDVSTVEDHFAAIGKAELVDNVRNQIRSEQESPFSFFDAIYWTVETNESEDTLVVDRGFHTNGIANRVLICRPVETSDGSRLEEILIHRKIIEEAQRFGYSNVLIMNGDILVNQGAAFHLGRTLEKLYELEWDLLYLGDGLNSAPGIFPQRFGHLTTANSISTWTAVCYNQTAYQTILEIIPEKRKSTTKWCSKGGGITTCHEKLDKKFLAVPSVVTRLAGKPIEKKLNKLED